MKQALTSLTKKGQVTIPVEIRRLLGIAPHDKVAFIAEGNQVRVIRAGSIVEQTAGAFKGLKPLQTAEELRTAAEIAIAEEIVERMRE